MYMKEEFLLGLFILKKRSHKKRSLKKPYKWVSARTPQLTITDVGKGIDAAIGPLTHWVQPSQYVGAIRDAVKGKNLLISMLRGNSGVVSEEYAAEHPWISTALNLGTDLVVPISFMKGKPYLKEETLGAPKVPENFNKFTPKITAENSATVTDAEWDAAYNTAIKARDMAEAQRLRDLHFYG